MIETNSPILRFPEFVGKWNTKKLSSYLKVKTEKNRNGEFSRNDVLSVSGQYGVVNQIAHLGRSYAGESLREYKVVRTGEVVYTKSPLSSNPYGIIKGNFGPSGIVSTLYAVYRPTELVTPNFIDKYFENPDNMNRYLRPLVNKGAKNDMKIPNERVLIDPVTFPSLEEQKKIVAFLTAVEEKIESVETQLEIWRKCKLGMMQAIFSKKLRFKADDGSDFPNWERKKIKQFAKVNEVAKDIPAKFNYIDLEAVKNGRLGTTRIFTHTEAPSRAQRPLSKGEILFQTVRPYQMNNLMFKEDGQYVASTGYTILRSSFSQEYLFQFIHTRNFVNEVSRRCTGTSYPVISSTDLANMTVKLPCLAEQNKIAEALSALDAKIDALTDRLNLTREFKRGLLQKMFV